MHTLEPYYNWRIFYTAEEDANSPFYGKEYSEMYFTDAIYDHYIHPQWDFFGSNTLYMKILYADYTEGYAILEFIGEWNDAIGNDIMFLKREILEHLLDHGIDKFILIGENVLNFHGSDDSYYEEWFDEIEDGWIAMVNFRDHVIEEFKYMDLDQYFVTGGKLEEIAWRTLEPPVFYEVVAQYVAKRLA